MAHDPNSPPPPETFARLAAAHPAVRTELVLRLIETHPKRRLELPTTDGHRASLQGVRLGRPALADALPPGEPPAWWTAYCQGGNLRGAAVRGADLSHAA